MPAIITHQLFGETILEELLDAEDLSSNEDVAADAPIARRAHMLFASQGAHDAFLLGNQGPDPLFYALRTRNLVTLKKLGQKMHRTNIAQTLAAFASFSELANEVSKPVTQAYLLGFLCHYVLDSTTHPLVYAQQTELIEAGVAGLDENAASQIHGQIEADLDVYMLWRNKHASIRGYKPHKEILRASNETLDIINRMYQFMAASAYGLILAKGEFRRAVLDMRLSTHALYSARGFKRRHLGRVERLARHHSLAQAMSHRNHVYDTCDWDNRDHRPWRYPETNEQRTDSWDDLYEQALQVALLNCRHLLAGGKTDGIVVNKDFYGNPKD